MGSQEEFAREYFKMYQKSMKIIAEEERKRSNATANLNFVVDEDIEDTLGESPASRMFH